MHKLCAELKAAPGSLSVLDVGTGPTIAYSISIAPYALNIVFAEYIAPNRAALTAWLQNQKDAYDWKPYFKMVVTEMEGKNEMEVEKRIAMVREKVIAVVPCDITKDPPIPQEYMHKYDIVQSFLCLDGCLTVEECIACINRMASLVIPSGKIILYLAEVERESFYVVGTERFFCLPISKASVVQAIEDAGFSDVKLTILPPEQVDNPIANLICFFFVSATKK